MVAFVEKQGCGEEKRAARQGKAPGVREDGAAPGAVFFPSLILIDFLAGLR